MEYLRIVLRPCGETSADPPELVKIMMFLEVLPPTECLVARSDEILHYQLKMLTVQKENGIAKFVDSPSCRFYVSDQEIDGRRVVVRLLAHVPRTWCFHWGTRSAWEE